MKLRIGAFEDVLNYFDMILLKEGSQDSAAGTISLIRKIKVLLDFDEIIEEITKDYQFFLLCETE